MTIRKRQRSRRTLRNRDLLANRAAEICRAAGARKVIRLDWAPLILHVQSSMRMGHREDDSVCRPTGEARFVDGLFIADNSILPNALGGPNPTLTTQALATRTAEIIAQRFFDRDPWVRTGTPVQSTDPRISAALAGESPTAPPQAAPPRLVPVLHHRGGALRRRRPPSPPPASCRPTTPAAPTADGARAVAVPGALLRNFRSPDARNLRSNRAPSGAPGRCAGPPSRPPPPDDLSRTR